MSKVMTLAEAAASIPDGATVALGGLATQYAPMAMVRELIRRKASDLTIVVIAGGLNADMLIGAGCVRKVIGALITFAQFGLAPNFRRAVERGNMVFEEYGELSLLQRLNAAARNLPFLPTRSLLGTDLIDLHPEETKIIECPFTGQKLVACRALQPDVAILHAHRADPLGNVQMDPCGIWPDIETMPRASKRVIVTVEKIVSTEEIKRRPELTFIPRFNVDAVVEVPYGAHPYSCWPVYFFDGDFYRAYVEAGATENGFAQFLDQFVYGPADHAAYLECIGGASALLRLRL